MNLNTFLSSLSSMPADAPLVFATDLGEIGSGYHVTEFKHANITGIDCGARRSEWSEASMQLLDGHEGDHMKAGKLARILELSLGQVPGLGAAEFHVEFAHRNQGMRKYFADKPELKGDKVYVQMDETTAVCKPASEMGVECGPSNCCPPKAQSVSCCG
ncbi:MAG: DUF6428 family protein [Boseongicola sp.]